MSVPQLLGKYQIIEELGHGGFATVYRAHDPDLGLDVALKILEPNLMRDRAFVARFRTEARVAARLRHPNIARVLNIDQSEGRLFIAIEYVSARNLRDRLAEQPLLDWQNVSSIVQQVAEALDYAHAQGVLHRDVKPGNILVADSGAVVLTDFGLAKAAEGSQVTTSGVAVGTYAYMAPEQASGKDIDARADLYSLGVVAYELCTGRVPFTSDSTPALLHDQVYTPPPAPSQVNARVAAPIETVLLKALAKEREQRYQSGKEFATDLSAAIEQVTGTHLTALYQQAMTLAQQGDLDGAEVALRQVLAIRPDHTNAQALLVEIGKKREAQQRYQQLAQKLMALRAEAADLHQGDPRLPDPDGVLQALLDKSLASLSGIAVQSKPAGEHQAIRLLRKMSAVLIVIGVITIVVGMSIYGQSLFPDYAITSYDNAIQEFGSGSLVLGIGLGVTMTSVVVLALSTRKSKA